MMKRITAWSLAALTSVAAACSFDLGDHPASCRTNADCGRDQYCFENICIPDSGTNVDGTSGKGGSSGSSGGSGANAGAGAAGHAGSSMGSMDSGSSMMTIDGATDLDATSTTSSDASVLDSGTPRATVPYAACADDMDCMLGETCRVTSGKGVCGLPCTMVSQCSKPTSGTAVAACGSDGRCKLNCATKFGSGPPQIRACPADKSCVSESPQQSWQVAEQTCYPK